MVAVNILVRLRITKIEYSTYVKRLLNTTDVKQQLAMMAKLGSSPFPDFTHRYDDILGVVEYPPANPKIP